MQTLALAYVISVEDTYATRAKKAALALANHWIQWTDPDYREGWTVYSSFDLWELTTAVFYVYNMLFDFLTPYEKMTLQNAILTLGVGQTYLDATIGINGKSNFQGSPNGHAKALSTLGIGSLAVFDSNGTYSIQNSPEHNTAKANVDSLFKIKAAFDSKGGYVEGLNYAAVALTALVRFVEAEKIAGDYDYYTDEPASSYLQQFSYFPLYSVIPGNKRNVNFCDSDGADNGLWGQLCLVPVTRLAAVYGNENAQWYLKENWVNQNYLYSLLWLDGELDTLNPDATLPLGREFSDIGWVEMRTGWDAEDYLLAFKSGKINYSHQHFDNNNFIFGTNQKWLIGDWGYARGSTEEIEKRRSSSYHNVILVNSTGQDFLNESYVLNFYTSAEYGYFSGDASDSYPDNLLDQFTRKMVMINTNGCVVMFDDIVITGSTPKKIDWLLHTFINTNDVNETVSEQDSLINIKKGTENLRVKILEPVGSNAVIIDQDTKDDSLNWKQIVVSKDSVTAVQYLSVFYPYNTGEALPSITQINGTTTIGARVTTDSTDQVVMFSSDGDTVKMTEYSFNTSSAVTHSSILVDLIPDHPYLVFHEDLTNGGTRRLNVKASDQGTLRFEFPLQAGTHRIKVLAEFLSDTVEATATNAGRKILYDKATSKLHQVYQASSVVLHSEKLLSGPGNNWSTIPIGGGEYPALSADASGNLYTIAVSPEAHNNLLYAKYTHILGWTEFVPLFDVAWIPEETPEFSPPSLAMEDSLAHLVYETLVQNTITNQTTYTLYYRNMDTSPNPPNPPILLEETILDSVTISGTPDIGYPLTSTTITLDKNYTPHVIWSRPIGPGNGEIYYKMRGGANWPAYPETLSQTPTPSLRPFIDYNPYDSTLHVVWEEEITGTHTEIWHRWKTIGMATWDTITVVSDTSANAVARSPVMDDNFAFFSQKDTTGPSEIYYTWWQPPVWAGLVNFSQTSTSSDNPHAAVTLQDCVTRLDGIWTEGDSPGLYEVRFKSTSSGYPCLGGGPQSGGEGGIIPKVFRLFQNAPNPFHSSAKIRYHLPRVSPVNLKIYDLTGRLIRTLLEEDQKAGVYTISWDGKDLNGQKVSSGVYFYRLTAQIGQAGEKTATRKMVLLK